MKKILASVMLGGWILLVFLSFWPVLGQAHNTRLSSAQVNVQGENVSAIVEVNGLDVEVALSMKINAADGNVAPDLAAAGRPRIEQYLLSKVHLRGAEGDCPGAGEGVTPKGDHLLVKLRWRCASGTGLNYEATLFQEIDPAARHMMTATGDARAFALLNASNAKVSLSRTPSKLSEVLWRYLLSGIEHIAIGYDHIAFLVAVILWARRFWPLFAVITAFTVAHSITLSLAALDLVNLPSKLVETAIALSIVYVAAENFFVRDIRRRWILTFLFGLIHGFGFASVLREYGIPQDRLGWALAAFNVGVEIGQLAIVALAFAIIYTVGRVWKDAALDSERRKVFVWSVSAVILALGVYWAIDRMI
jgi:hydrogenase/urease accessory protein HupE